MQQRCACASFSPIPVYSYIAQFWTTFFEQAAQIRVPTYDDYSLQHDSKSEVDSESIHEQSSVESSVLETPDQSRAFDPDGTSSEVSFAPGQAAISSTPARYKVQGDQDGATPSWNASLESPLVRLDREIQSLTEDDEAPAASSSKAEQTSRYEEDSQDMTQRQIPLPEPQDQTIQPQVDKGKGRAPTEPLLRGVLLRNTDTSVGRSMTGVSPLKVKQKTPIVKSSNPYLPPDTKPSDWKGVVNLADPHISTPGRRGSPAKRKPSSAKRPTTPHFNEDDDSFDEGLGMSPPIMMDFARLPKAKTPKLGRTPRKEAAERIVNSLVSTESITSVFSSARIGGSIFTRPGAAPSIESSMSSVPSPPSLSKYTRRPYPSAPETNSSLADASLESMMRRVGLNMPGFTEHHSNASKNDSPEAYGSVPTSTFLPPAASQAADPEMQPTLDMPLFDFSRVQVDDDGFGAANASIDSMDSFEEANNTANPSAAFIMASQRGSFDDDDSFDSNQGDSIDFEDQGNLVNPHPFAQGLVIQEGESFDDDSFDDPVFDQRTEEETLFGVPPAQRIQAHAMFQNRMSSGGNLQMLGQDMLEDTLGVGAQRASAGSVQETPTPWSGGQPR